MVVLDMSKNTKPDSSDVRFDKWLWAARFYKTRAIARDMIQSGKIRYNDQRTKPSKTVELGATIKIKQGFDEKEVIVKQLSAQRRGAPEAATLYEETPSSVEKRAQNDVARKLNTLYNPCPDKRPDKKQRRELLRIKNH
ncbi:ribosome-associated heat shock protein Hsp15 [Moritella sp.]|uniref:ribosome-associated heat shock protein Hsp15 n=1 Tax=Moritella sp. TaxID=78556 RepID=UPI001D328B20|nr:ribosome-associated heat shock protein Hsp15 [Moritella sp.]MCJ8352212.1 ribosome-associated heat shock protein Hsp15 [Moritella sp.]NQZ42483.1 ribosome-associated heat shock protein Hsp15 [Moritella sp.]